MQTFQNQQTLAVCLQLHLHMKSTHRNMLAYVLSLIDTNLINYRDVLFEYH